MTMELFIPWRAMGLEEKPENADLIMMPAYFMQKGGMYRNICPLPYYPSSSAAYYLFDETGYAHADKEGALIGSAKNGHTKTGVWEEENVEKNEENGKITLSGTVRTEKSTYSKGYVKDLLAENFIFSATAKPLEGAYEATVGVSVGIPNGRRKLLSVRAENGSLSSKTRIAANYYADDYDGRNNVDAPLFRYTREKTLAGVRVTVTAGPTQESLDPVRYLTNHSSGRMGYAIAREAMLRGAQVTLISGPVSLAPVPGVAMRPVTTAKDMLEAVQETLPETDILIKAAAVADYRPATVADQKIKKKDGDMSIPLERTDDILGWVEKNRHPGLFVCGFSMDTENMVENSRAKLEKKHLDMIAANNLKTEGAGFGVATNVVTLITKDGIKELPLMGKDEVAGCLLDEIAARR